MRQGSERQRKTYANSSRRLNSLLSRGIKVTLFQSFVLILLAQEPVNEKAILKLSARGISILHDLSEVTGVQELWPRSIAMDDEAKDKVTSADFWLKVRNTFSRLFG